MSDVVIAALIGAVVTLVGNVLNNLSQRKNGNLFRATESISTSTGEYITTN